MSASSWFHFKATLYYLNRSLTGPQRQSVRFEEQIICYCRKTNPDLMTRSLAPRLSTLSRLLPCVMGKLPSQHSTHVTDEMTNQQTN